MIYSPEIFAEVKAFMEAPQTFNEWCAQRQCKIILCERGFSALDISYTISLLLPATIISDTPQLYPTLAHSLAQIPSFTDGFIIYQSNNIEAFLASFFTELPRTIFVLAYGYTNELVQTILSVLPGDTLTLRAIVPPKIYFGIIYSKVILSDYQKSKYIQLSGGMSPIRFESSTQMQNETSQVINMRYPPFIGGYDTAHEPEDLLWYDGGWINEEMADGLPEISVKFDTLCKMLPSMLQSGKVVIFSRFDKHYGLAALASFLRIRFALRPILIEYTDNVEVVREKISQFNTLNNCLLLPAINIPIAPRNVQNIIFLEGNITSTLEYVLSCILQDGNYDEPTDVSLHCLQAMLEPNVGTIDGYYYEKFAEREQDMKESFWALARTASELRIISNALVVV